MRRIAQRLTLAGSLALSAIAPSALADPADATERAAAEYDAGTRAFGRGEFGEAARAFERADAIAPHPRTRYNAALSWDRAGDAPRAADAYSAALEGKGLDSERVEAARSRLQELTLEIGAIDVRRPSGGTVSVAHVSGAAIPARIHVLPGVHRVELTNADGSRNQREVEVRAGERVVLEIAITKAPLAAASPRPAPRPAPAPVPERETSSGGTTWGLVALGGAAAFGAGAVVLGMRTGDAIDEFDASGDRDAEARERAVRFRALTWAAGGASLACATIGIVLLVGAGGDDADERAGQPRFELGIRPGGAAAAWRF